ncbi:MAG: DNA polymerase/3'-5' exonuclease PolX [Gemmatimonadales bacterium]|nr:DNA polymerase/3'-5' exonuclease PolX [Gemmatimonadales bacterium]
MAMMDKKAVASVLEQVASFMELKGDNPFRVRAVRTAARTIEGLAVDLDAALADGQLAGTRGIGPATLQVITELVRTGRSSLLEELRGQVPPGLVEMLDISGLGVAKIRQIHETLGIDSIPELEAAAQDGRLAALPRFGQKTAENILKGIAFRRKASAFRLFHHAAEEAEMLAAALATLPGVLAVHVAGEVRRRLEVVQEVSLVVVADVAPSELFERLAQLPGVSEFAGRDERSVTLRTAAGDRAQVIVTTPVNAGAVLAQATGCARHLEQLAAHAASRGLALTGAALWRGSVFVPTPDETAFYAALGLPCIAPELREGQDEVAAAAAGALPRLLERGDIRGFLHCHSTFSDGANTVEEMARAAQAAGYEYLGLTDHSRTAAYAGGLSIDDLQRQADEVDAVNARLGPGFRVLKGIESDILVDGALDYPDEVLARLDFVIGSIHGRFNLPKAEMTARVLRALEHPRLTILGHPTGRLLLSREPYAIDLDAVIAKAAETGVALEINADPHRLDLDWRMVRAARAAGALVSIGADAHNTAGIANVPYGVGIARKGWLRPEDVLNTRDVAGFLAVARRRG